MSMISARAKQSTLGCPAPMAGSEPLRSSVFEERYIFMFPRIHGPLAVQCEEIISTFHWKKRSSMKLAHVFLAGLALFLAASTVFAQPANKPYCTKIACKNDCGKSCHDAKAWCLSLATRLQSQNLDAITKKCANAAYSKSHRCQCGLIESKAKGAALLQGMQRCMTAKCNKIKCCPKGAKACCLSGFKMCYPLPPGKTCANPPCCKALVCAPMRCK